MSSLESLVGALQKLYGALPSPPRDPFGLFVWEVLCVQSTPRKRYAAFGTLRRIRALMPDAMARAPRKKLEDSIALAGPYAEQRVRALRTGADRFRRSPNPSQVIRGSLTDARRAPKRLPQLGEGGAHRILLFAAHYPVLPVDAPVRRVARRLGYADKHADRVGAARSIRAAAVGELPGEPEAFCRAFLYLSNDGSTTCTEADPHCTICPLLSRCGYGISSVKRRVGAVS